MKLYVIGKAVLLPGLGTRQPGECFEMSKADCDQYKAHPNLTTTAPKKTKESTPEPEPEPVESEDNES